MVIDDQMSLRNDQVKNRKEVPGILCTGMKKSGRESPHT